MSAKAPGRMWWRSRNVGRFASFRLFTRLSQSLPPRAGNIWLLSTAVATLPPNSGKQGNENDVNAVLPMPPVAMEVVGCFGTTGNLPAAAKGSATREQSGGNEGNAFWPVPTAAVRLATGSGTIGNSLPPLPVV
jgi:hypothetical protein